MIERQQKAHKKREKKGQNHIVGKDGGPTATSKGNKSREKKE